jgi:hypothetical protein
MRPIPCVSILFGVKTPRRDGGDRRGQAEVESSFPFSKSSSLERLKSRVTLIPATMFDMGWSISSRAKAF